MSFNIDEVMENMLGSALEAVGPISNDIGSYTKRIIENEKEAITELAQQRLNGDLTDEEFADELLDEKDTFEAEMQAIGVMTKVMAQKAANAAMDVLSTAVKLAI